MSFLDDFFSHLSATEQDDAEHEEALYNKIDNAVDLVVHYKEQMEGFRDRCFQMAEVIRNMQKSEESEAKLLEELKNQVAFVCNIFNVNKSATAALLKCFDFYIDKGKRNG